MRRFPWDILLALVVGIGLGLVYAWLIHPLGVRDADPSTLRGDFKEQYRLAIAAAYAANKILPRAEARLELLKDSDPVEALNAQAQQMFARGESARAADQVAALARAIKAGPEEKSPASNPSPPVAAIMEETSAPVSSSPLPEFTSVLTETPPALPEETQPALSSSTPRPTSTALPSQPVPFKLTGQDEVCDPNLPEGLLQILVLSSSRKQMPGMEIDITWENGEEKFFTGLKPELGIGYADFIMTPEVAYNVQLASGSDIAAGLIAPTCQDPAGENYTGGIKLTFQRP